MCAFCPNFLWLTLRSHTLRYSHEMCTNKCSVTTSSIVPRTYSNRERNISIPFARDHVQPSNTRVVHLSTELVTDCSLSSFPRQIKRPNTKIAYGYFEYKHVFCTSASLLSEFHSSVNRSRQRCIRDVFGEIF